MIYDKPLCSNNRYHHSDVLLKELNASINAISQRHTCYKELHSYENDHGLALRIRRKTELHLILFLAKFNLSN